MKFNLVTFTQMLAGGDGLLASVAWKSFAILLLVVIVTALWRRGSATARHLLWTTMFFCLLCLPVFVQLAPAWHPPAWIVPVGLYNSLPDSVSFDSQKLIPAETESLPAVSENTGGASDLIKKASPTVSVKRATVSWSGIAVAIWLAGMILAGARWMVVQIRLHHLSRQMGSCHDSGWLKLVENLRLDYRIKRPVKLLISDAALSPITWGFWKPVVVLPSESRRWSSERLNIVLRHELTHVKRWDCFTQEMAHAACVLYWFNPLVWMAAIRMRAEREKACDDFVLSTGAQPMEYAGHLVEIARQFTYTSRLSGAVAMARPSGLEQRVVAILDGRRNRNVLGKIATSSIVFAIFSLGLLIGGCSNINSSTRHSEIKTQLKAFVSKKQAQESTLIAVDEKDYARENLKYKVPDCRPFFAAAARNDWQTASYLLSELEKGVRNPNETNSYPHGLWLQPVRETFGAIDAFVFGNERYSKAFGGDVIESLPAGSIYFGGTDPGRFIITALQKSHTDGDPFFTLTQNALADGTYLKYLRTMWGEKIYIPTGEDAQKCFQEYQQDVMRRLQSNQLKPGEHITNSDGRVSISGKVSVMQINGLLAKIIFDKNPDREFYVEESFPLDWMYPHLEPHGLIFKINRQPLIELSAESVRRDHKFWIKYIQPMIGEWLDENTSVETVTTFAEKVFLQRDFSGFQGDPSFVQNHYSCNMFSKLRSSIAGLYVWRMNHAANSEEKERMAREADFAYRQALALCPYSPETAGNYADFLTSRDRKADARLVTDMAEQFRTKSSGASAPQPTKSVFQMRLVVDAPSDDSETMTMTLDFQNGTVTSHIPPQILNVQKEVLLDHTALKSVVLTKDQRGSPVIEFTLTDSGRKRFADIKRQHLRERLAIIVEGKLLTAPVIASEITGGKGQVTGSFSEQEARDMTAKIKAAITR